MSGSSLADGGSDSLGLLKRLCSSQAKGRATLENHAPEEAGGKGRRYKVARIDRAGRLTKESDIAWVAAELSDVPRTHRSAAS